MTVHLAGVILTLKCRYVPFYRDFIRRSGELVEAHGLHHWFKRIPPVRPYHAAAVRFLRDNCPRDGIVVETGCGMGQTFVVLKRIGFRHFVGIDTGAAAIQAARQLLDHYGIRARLCCDDGLNLTRHVLDGSVDALLALNWTYFLDSIAPVFETGWQALKPGGFLVIDILDAHDPRKKSEPGKRSYALAEARSLAEEAGFEVVRVDEGLNGRFNLNLRKPGDRG